MKILTSEVFQRELKEILESIAQEDYEAAKKFKMYLDTIIINMSSKEKKYKKSIYFDNDDIKDIEFQGCVIPFLVDKSNTAYIILSITKKG